MTGTRLEVEMYLVTVQSTAAQNLRRSVERARYRPADLVLEPLAASYAVLTDDERELGVALVEVGGGSTGVAILHEGKIRHLASIKFAGTHVTSDMMQGLGGTQAGAERPQHRPPPPRPTRPGTAAASHTTPTHRPSSTSHPPHALCRPPRPPPTPPTHAP